MLASAASLLGCGGSSDERVLARIGDRVITEEMFLERVESGGPSTIARAKTSAGRRAILEAMIKHEVVMAEAERRNLRGDREVRDSVNPMLAKRLLEKDFDPTIRIEDVDERDVRALYEERHDEFHHPETYRFGVIQAESPEKASEIMARLAEGRNDKDVFESIASTPLNADETLRRMEGNYGYLPLEELRRAIPEDLRPHFERLRQTDERPEIVTIPRGTFVVMMTGHRERLDREYDSVKSGLRQQAFRKYREEKLDAFVANFRRHHKVRVNYELLGMVRVLPPEPRQRRTPAPTEAVERDGGPG